MKGGSLLWRFVRAWRDFGFVVAAKVAFSKIRGGLFPTLALAEPPAYDGPPRQLTILFDAARQHAAGLQAAVDVLAKRGGLDWEICICDRPPVARETARKLAQLRGTAPWIRVVSADASTNAVTASQWTVEQSTGEFVAVVGQGYWFTAEAIAVLLSRLHEDPAVEAALLLAPDELSSGLQSDACRLVLQRKSQYLAVSYESWPLQAPALARTLAEKGVPTAIFRTEPDPSGGRNLYEAL